MTGIISRGPRNSTGVAFPMQGRGIMAGGPDGARAVSILSWGPMLVDDGDAIGGYPRIGAMPAETVLATGTVDLSVATRQLVTVVPGLDTCIFTRVLLSGLSGVPGANVRGGIYAAEPYATNGQLANQPASAVIDEATDLPTLFAAARVAISRGDATLDASAASFAAISVTAILARHKPVSLWYCPKLAAGSAAAFVNSSSLTMRVDVLGVPDWTKYS